MEFNPAATVDDDSCAILTVNGCTDPRYVEFNVEANTDDASCATLGTLPTQTVNIKLMDDNGIHTPHECSYTGEFDCAALAACKSTLPKDAVSYLESREAICNPTQTAKRKKAALESGDAPFGWSDGDDNVWAVHQPLEGKAKPPFDDFAAKLKLMNAAAAALENAKKQYNDAVAEQKRQWDRQGPFKFIPLGSYNIFQVNTAAAAWNMAGKFAKGASDLWQATIPVTTVVNENRRKKCYDGDCNRRVMCQYKDDDWTNPSAQLVTNNPNMKSRTTCEGVWE
jgi:hypothetical protein